MKVPREDPLDVVGQTREHSLMIGARERLHVPLNQLCVG